METVASLPENILYSLQYNTCNSFNPADHPYTFVNSVDPDETARTRTTSRLIRIYFGCHLIFDFWRAPPFDIMGMHRQKNPLQKLRGERYNTFMQTINQIYMQKFSHISATMTQFSLWIPTVWSASLLSFSRIIDWLSKERPGKMMMAIWYITSTSLRNVNSRFPP